MRQEKAWNLCNKALASCKTVRSSASSGAYLTVKCISERRSTLYVIRRRYLNSKDSASFYEIHTCCMSNCIVLTLRDTKVSTTNGAEGGRAPGSCVIGMNPWSRCRIPDLRKLGEVGSHMSGSK